MRPEPPGLRPLPTVLATLLACATPAALWSQGRTDYFNVESPQVKPITVARVGNHDWLLVCNTPDNSVEIWDTDESVPAAQRFRLRVRVGLEPVSVVFNPVNQRAYTADFLGDSVSMFSLFADANVITYRPLQTSYVGDEPMDLAVSADGTKLFVSHSTPGTFGWRDATTLAPVALVPPLTDMTAIDTFDSDSAPTKALKEPRALEVQGNKLFVLGFKGGNAAVTAPYFPYDFDLYCRDLTTQALTQLGSLGTTNFNMAFATNGDLWVVGSEAQNLTTNNETEVRIQPTGFVKSTIYRVQGAGGASPAITRRDLNDTDGTGTHVDAAFALAQPTDVVAYEPGGGIYKVYFTAFGSDRVGVLTPTSSGDPYAWPLARISIPVAAQFPPNPVSGPRGLALKYANPSDPTDPGARVYVLNRLDNSFSILKPSLDAWVATIALHHDPTPDYIRQGRQFLYSAKFSQYGFVSCASCHMDGRTDSLLWKLGTPNVALIPYPDGLAEGTPEPDFFQQDKGAMMTQSLQGLINFEVEPAVQDFFTNAPYHWRADKASLLEFNAAFVNLMGNLDPDHDGKGISDAEMETLRTFVNSIHYPPNPAEPTSRTYSGSAVTDPFDENSGSLAQRGQLMFHVRPMEEFCDGRSCVQCHSLAEGSNNKTTVPSLDPTDTAQLRGLFQREAVLEKSALYDPGTIVTANFGLTHLGTFKSINHFIKRFQTEFGANEQDKLLDIKRFVREFDTGVAPLVGRPYTVTPNNKTAPDTVQTLDLFEAQAGVGNVGLAVLVRTGSSDSGYWFDETQTPAAYRLEGGATLLTRAQLLALCGGIRDRQMFIATPLGSERRVASVSGTSQGLVGSAPTNLELRPCPTNTVNAPVPTFRNNWDPFPVGNPQPTPFVWNGTALPTPPSLKTIRLLQRGLIVDGQGLYGLTELRHEAPRRLSVAGSNILPGAKLRLFVPKSSTPPDPSGPLGQIQTIELELPIYPTATVLIDGRHVWQTAVELEPNVLYQFMLGGPLAQGVHGVLSPLTVGSIEESPSTYVPRYAPQTSNWHYVKVVNPDGQEGVGGWQRLKVQ